MRGWHVVPRDFKDAIAYAMAALTLVLALGSFSGSGKFTGLFFVICTIIAVLLAMWNGPDEAL